MVKKRAEQKVVEISYAQFGGIADKLTQKIKSKFGKNLDRVSGVYGVPRGGTAFALHMSHHLGVPMLKKPEDDCLVLDDISDSGKTLLPYQKKGYIIVTLFYKKKSVVIPDVYFRIVDENNWIVFPWENLKELEE